MLVVALLLLRVDLSGSEAIGVDMWCRCPEAPGDTDEAVTVFITAGRIPTGIPRADVDAAEGTCCCGCCCCDDDGGGGGDGDGGCGCGCEGDGGGGGNSSWSPPPPPLERVIWRQGNIDFLIGLWPIPIPVPVHLRCAVAASFRGAPCEGGGGGMSTEVMCCCDCCCCCCCCGGCCGGVATAPIAGAGEGTCGRAWGARGARLGGGWCCPGMATVGGG